VINFAAIRDKNKWQLEFTTIIPQSENSQVTWKVKKMIIKRK